MTQYERIYQSINGRSKIEIRCGLDYDGTMYLFIESVSQIASTAIRQILVEFPSLIERRIKVDYAESDVLPPDKKIKYPHSHVDVTITWLADECKEDKDEDK